MFHMCSEGNSSCPVSIVGPLIAGFSRYAWWHCGLWDPSEAAVPSTRLAASIVRESWRRCCWALNSQHHRPCGVYSWVSYCCPWIHVVIAGSYCARDGSFFPMPGHSSVSEHIYVLTLSHCDSLFSPLTPGNSFIHLVNSLLKILSH